MTFEQVEDELQAIMTYVTDANTRIGEGEELELEGLDEKVEEICKQIEKLDPEQAQAAEPLLQDMIRALDELAHTIKEKGGFEDDEGGDNDNQDAEE